MLSKLKHFLSDNRRVLILAILINIFFGLIPAPLFDEDEGFTAEVSREMLKNQEFVLLESNFEPRYDKPPLGFWIISGSLYLLGNNEIAARLPSILFSVALLAVIYFFSKKRLGETRATISTLFCVGTLQFSIMSKAAIADPFLYFFLVSAILSYLQYLQESKPKYLYIFTLCNALAFLTKGPIVLFISGVVVLASSFKLKNYKILFKVLHYKQILLFLAVVLPWFVISYQKVGMLMIEDFFFKHNLGRFSKSMEGHSGSYFYYVIVFLVGFTPFSFAHFSALSKAVREKLNLIDFLFLVWFSSVFLLFTFSATKLPHYLMLGFFPLVMFSSGYVTTNKLKHAKVVALVFILLLLVAPFLAQQLTPKLTDIYAQKLIQGFPEVFGFSYYLSISVCAAAVCFSLKFKNNFGFILFFLIAINITLIKYATLQQGPIKELAKIVDTEIVMKNHYTPSFSFYTQKPHVIRDLKPGDFSIGKNIDFRHYETKVIYEKYGTVWVEVLSDKKQ